MAHWVMHVEGSGPAEDGLLSSAPDLLARFIAQLGEMGHDVHRASVTVGACRDLIQAVEPRHSAW